MELIVISPQCPWQCGKLIWLHTYCIKTLGEWWCGGRQVPSLPNVAVWTFYWIFTHLLVHMYSSSHSFLVDSHLLWEANDHCHASYRCIRLVIEAGTEGPEVNGDCIKKVSQNIHIYLPTLIRILFSSLSPSFVPIGSTEYHPSMQGHGCGYQAHLRTLRTTPQWCTSESMTSSLSWHALWIKG